MSWSVIGSPSFVRMELASPKVHFDPSPVIVCSPPEPHPQILSQPMPTAMGHKQDHLEQSRPGRFVRVRFPPRMSVRRDGPVNPSCFPGSRTASFNESGCVPVHVTQFASAEHPFPGAVVDHENVFREPEPPPDFACG